MSSIPVFLASDNNYAPYVASTIASICFNTKSFIDFYILDGGITRENIEKIELLKEKFNNFSIEFIKIDLEKEFASIQYSNIGDYISLSTYNRLLIPQLKPELNKVLYSDVDVIVLGDIKEMYDEDLEGNALGAVWEEYGEETVNIERKKRLNLAGSHKYFSAGNIIIDCKKWREEKIAEKIIELEQIHRNNLHSADMDLMNIYFSNNYKELNAKYCLFALDFIKYKDIKPIIRHFPGPKKPWHFPPQYNIELSYPNHREFWYYMKMTAFYKELAEELAKNKEVNIEARHIMLNCIAKRAKGIKMPKISVIIPIYNVEKYLTKCLDSVINQTFKDIEILCVNDCSPDNSLQILEDYAQKDNRIKIINREKNGGLSAARNNGLDVAQGEYVYFIDSDDWIDLDYLEKMYNAAIESGSSVIVNPNMIVNIDGENKNSPFPDEINCTTDNQFVHAKKNILKLAWSACASLWRLEFLKENNLRFPEGYEREDDYFQAVAYSYIDNVYVIQGGAYYYRIRNESICANWRADISKKYKAYIRITSLIYEFYMKKNILKDLPIKIIVEEFYNVNENAENMKFIHDIKSFFTYVYPLIEQNKHLYTTVELGFVNDVIKDKLNPQANYYQKKKILDKIRKNINA